LVALADREAQVEQVASAVLVADSLIAILGLGATVETVEPVEVAAPVEKALTESCLHCMKTQLVHRSA